MLDKHLRMLGDLTGEFKQPQANPLDDQARAEKAIEMWIQECRRRGVKNPTREEAIRFLGPEMPEIRELGRIG